MKLLKSFTNNIKRLISFMSYIFLSSFKFKSIPSILSEWNRSLIISMTLFFIKLITYYFILKFMTKNLKLTL